MIYIEADTLRYFFSAIAQSMAALFAVGGIFAIYRFQFLEQQFSSAVESFREFYRRSISHVEIPPGTPATAIEKYAEDRRKAQHKADEANEWLDKDILSILLSEFKNNSNNIGILDYCYYFIKIIEARTAITKQMRCPIILIAINFVISILFLMVVDLLCKCTLTILAIILFVLTIFTIYKLFLYIKLCFNLPRTLEFNNKFLNSESLVDTRNSVIEKIKGIVKTYSDNELERLKSEMANFLKGR